MSDTGTGHQRSTTLGAVLFWIAAVGVIVLYAYAVVAAIGNWIGIAGYADALAGGLSLAGVLWLTLGVAIPVMSLALAVIVGRKRSKPVRLLILVLGLSLTAVMQLNVMHFVPTTSYFDAADVGVVLE